MEENITYIINFILRNPTIFGFILVLIIFLASGIRNVKEHERLAVYRLGRFLKIVGPGLVLIIPVIDKVVRVNLSEEVPRWQQLSKVKLEEKIKPLVESDSLPISLSDEPKSGLKDVAVTVFLVLFFLFFGFVGYIARIDLEIGPERPSIQVFEELAQKQLSNTGKIKVIYEDTRFVAYNNHIIKDSTTDLGWIADPDTATTWNMTKKWIESLNNHMLAGGGWRMPSREELKSIYQKGIGARNMTPLLKTTGWWVWSGEIYGYRSTAPKSTAPLAWFFNFKNGNDEYAECSDSYSSYNLFRGFAVRSRK